MNRRDSTKRELSKRSERPSTYRRVVTANVNGKAVVQSDEPLPAYEFKTVPGYEHTLVWVNPTTPDLREEQRFERYPDSVVPGPGGTSLHFVTFPPGSIFADPSFDGEAARTEALIRLRGLADHSEKEDPQCTRRTRSRNTDCVDLRSDPGQSAAISPQPGCGMFSGVASRAQELWHERAPDAHHQRRRPVSADTDSAGCTLHSRALWRRQ